MSSLSPLQPQVTGGGPTPFSKPLTIGFLGLGAMAGALAQCWLQSPLAKHLRLWGLVSSSHSVQQKQGKWPFSLYDPATYGPQLAQSQVVVLAVKPFQVATVLAHLKAQCAQQGLVHPPLILSLVAGFSLAKLEALWEEAAPVGACTMPPLIRAMANLPIALGHGAVAWVAHSACLAEHKKQVATLLAPCGHAIATTEGLMDSWTALIGSSPAFILLAMEAFLDGAVQLGLPRAQAAAVLPSLFSGTAHWWEGSGQHPAVLKSQITTPGGTTAAGLAVLEDEAVRSALAKALAAAAYKAAGLG